MGFEAGKAGGGRAEANALQRMALQSFADIFRSNGFLSFSRY